MGTQVSDQPDPPERPGAEEEAPGGRESADGLLVRRLRRGDADAGYRFFREYYPAVYRYLCYLTERPEQAEDLAQETFVRAWLYLERFDPRGSLRAWLHRIAHREFLRSLPRETPASLERIGEVAAPEATAFMAAAALRQIVRRLPAAEREVVLLHDLEGYSSREIATIVGDPASTVRRRLAQARERLRQELGEGDLPYLNEPSMPMRQWAWLPLDQMFALEARLVRRGQGARTEDEMERREFLRHAAVGAAGLMLPETEKEIVDSRLTQKVICAFKGTALSDLCEKLKSDTGIQLTAGPSVADEKVTLFCEKLPLRDVMRQLSRPFGYTWLRSGTPGQYRYELVQDLRSQLLEEELRNRDRNAALLALDRDVERYRPYLSLSPVEAEERLKTAPESEKPLLEKIGGRDGNPHFGMGWGPIQMYFRLSRAEQEALRAGQELVFTTRPGPGERLLPPEVARGVLESYRDWRVHVAYGVWDIIRREDANSGDRPLTAVPEVCAGVSLRMKLSELGTLILDGSSRVFSAEGEVGYNLGSGPYASGRSPAVEKVENARLNARFAADPALRPLVTVRAEPSYRPTVGEDGAAPLEPQVTSADLLEAFHRATGLPVVGDYYTRLYPPEKVSVRDEPLFQALNQLADAMRLRWTLADGNWLQFRSASYYDDRLKEVPNRLLARWSAARQQRGFLSLDDLVEIAGLPDAPLDGREMAEGAREIWGLHEWDLPSNGYLRPHLRYLALFTPEQRQQAMTAEGLPFVKMSLPQQQQFMAQGVPIHIEASAGAALRVEYTQPGEFEWGDPRMVWSWTRWFEIREPGRQGHWAPRPSVRARTREAVTQALLRLDPAIREAAVHRNPLRAQDLVSAPPPPVPLEAQIFPTRLDLIFVYIPSSSNEYTIKIVNRNGVTGQFLY